MQLDVADLACRRGGRLVFDRVSFSLASGAAIVVTGRNGAGKSTLLAALAGLIRPCAGTVALSGTGDRARSEFVHLLAHRDGLKSTLTPAENLAVAAGVLGAPSMPPREALAAVGLRAAADLPTAYLSAGQRRRVALARLLVARRWLWLLDEPGTALDREGQDLLGRVMADHLASGGAIVAATHAPLPIPNARELVLAEQARTQPDLAA